MDGASEVREEDGRAFEDADEDDAFAVEVFADLAAEFVDAGLDLLAAEEYAEVFRIWICGWFLHDVEIRLSRIGAGRGDVGRVRLIRCYVYILREAVIHVSIHSSRSYYDWHIRADAVVFRSVCLLGALPEL